MVEMEYRLLELQNQLATRMGDGLDLKSTATIALQIAIQASEMDCGGIYLLHEDPTRLSLVTVSGLGKEFIDSIETYLQNSDRWQMIMKARPIYSNYEELPLEKNKIMNQEGLCSVAILPLVYQNQVVGSLHVASHQIRKIDASQKKVLETISLQLARNFQHARQIEEQTKQSLNYQAILEAATDGMLVISFLGDIQYSNPSFAELMGVSVSKLIGSNLESLYHNLNSSSFQKFLSDITAQPEKLRNVKFSAADGNPLFFEVTAKFSMWNFEPVLILFTSPQRNLNPTPRADERQEIKYLFDLIPSATLIINTQTFTILHANRGFQDLFGIGSEELQSCNFLQYFSEKDYLRLVYVLRDKGLYGLVGDQGWKQVRKDGSVLDTFLNIYPIEWENQPAALVIIAPSEMDRLDENGLNAGRYREIINLQTDLVVRFTRDGMITFVNQAYCDFLNKDSSQMIGRNVFEGIHPSDVSMVKEHFSQISLENPLVQTRNLMIDVNGGWRQVDWIDRGIFNGQELVEIQGAGRDNSDEIQQSLLKETIEQRFQNLVEELPGVVYVLHAESEQPIYISPQFEQFSGYSLEEAYKNPDFIRSHIHPDDLDKIDQVIKRRAKGEKVLHFEYRFIKKDGQIIWIQEIISAIKTSDRSNLLQGLAMDVTESHQIRAQIDYYSKLERMINEISLALMNVRPFQWDDLVNGILESIGSLLEVDRSYVFCLDDDGKTISNTHEWCSEGISRQINNLQNMPLSEVDFWIDEMGQSDVVVIENVKKLPGKYKNSRRLLLAQSIKSLLLVSMKRNGEVCGFIGFDSVRTQKSWDEPAILLLRTVSQMLLNTKDRISPQKPHLMN